MYKSYETYILRDGSELKILEVRDDGIDAVLITPRGEYIEYDDVSPSTIDSILYRR